MQPANDIGYMLQHLAFSMSRQNDQILQERLGIGFSQFKILILLRSSPHVQQRYIADGLGQTEASISRQIKLMTEKGLLQRSISPGNRRQHITTLTDYGVKVTEEATQILNNYHMPMFERLSDKQRVQLSEILAVMHMTVCQHGKAGACHHPYSS